MVMLKALAEGHKLFLPGAICAVQLLCSQSDNTVIVTAPLVVFGLPQKEQKFGLGVRLSS